MAKRHFDKAWIVGASTGIGRELALELARRGVDVVASARGIDDLAALVKDAAGFPGHVSALALDVTDLAATQAAAQAATKLLGRIDLCVACAGTHQPFGAKDFDSGKFRRLVEVNLMGTVHVLEAVMPGFIQRRSGHLAVVSSVAGYRGLPSAAGYGATKAALINMCESLKFDLDRAGVKLQLIDPGFVETPLTAKNDFPMPFLMKADAAAKQFYRGLLSDRFEVTFPKRFTWQLKLLRCLPYAAYFPLIRRTTKALG
ncbi:MAG: SDR family NAD(P)-dependent oxidoreductase [Alphaproteobacteria bacterium]|jgi:NAD(P)-dependent dehydrogenase (short-subunit alcohol dehydrogenase family)